MRSAAATVAERGADLIDLNMGCPVPKVCKTGAGAALIKDPATAVAVAKAAREGSGLPVTVKLRSGQRPGETDGYELAHRLVQDAGVSAIGFHPRSAAVHHKGVPDYDLAAKLVASLPAPVILTGGLSDRTAVLRAYERTGAAAVMLARGSLGNPWLFAQLLGGRDAAATTAEILAELDWVMDRAAEHLGPERAARYLRKFYPWYVEPPRRAEDRAAGLQQTASLGEARAVLAGCEACPAPPDRRYTAPLELPTTPSRLPAPSGVFCRRPAPETKATMAEDVILTPEGLTRLKDELEQLQTDPPPRGGRAHQGGPGVRRHLGELRVRRRQERADDARAAHRAAGGAACARPRSSTRATCRRTPSSVGSVV